MEQLLEEVACGPLALLLNPGWSAGAAVPQQYQALADSFLVVYSFLPVAIQVGGREVGGGGQAAGLLGGQAEGLQRLRGLKGAEGG